MYLLLACFLKSRSVLLGEKKGWAIRNPEEPHRARIVGVEGVDLSQAIFQSSSLSRADGQQS